MKTHPAETRDAYACLETALADLSAEQDAHRVTKIELRLARFVGLLLAVLVSVNAYNRLHTVDMPQPRCTLTVEPKPIDNAPKVAGVEVWL